MAFRLEEKDFLALPKQAQEQLLLLDPDLRERMNPTKLTGIKVEDEFTFTVIIKDNEFCSFEIHEFAEEINEEIIKVWKEYLYSCIERRGRQADLLPMPHNIQRKIFDLLGLVKIYDDEVEKINKKLDELLEGGEE